MQIDQPEIWTALTCGFLTCAPGLALGAACCPLPQPLGGLLDAGRGDRRSALNTCASGYISFRSMLTSIDGALLGRTRCSCASATLITSFLRSEIELVTPL
jgi:hypothetical protein